MSEIYINDKELKITKENYIGYEALYEMQKKLNTKVNREQEFKYIICSFIVTSMLACLIIMLIIITENLAIFTLIPVEGGLIPALILHGYKQNRYKKYKKEITRFKEEYPEVDINYNIDQIEKTLKNENVDSFKEFEEKLRYEEEYKKFIENERYNYNDFEYFRELDEEIIEQVTNKVKKLVI